MISLTTLLIILAVVIFVAILIFFPKSRTLFKGLVGLFIEDVAKTPEGAAAVYSEAIEKAQDEYNKANDTLMKIAGQLNTAQKELESCKIELKRVEESCENFAKNQMWDKVEIYSLKREELADDLVNKETIVKQLTPLVEEAKVINNHCEQKLTALKKEKVKVINDLKMNKQLKEMYDDMDELKNITSSDKLLETVKEGVKETREQAVGARTVHNNKTTTKLKAADDEAKKLSSMSYAESLKKKYQK